MGTITSAFANTKLTENGDLSYSTTGNHYLDLLFFADYFTKHPGEAQIGTSEYDKVFAMMIRDPRFGLGYKSYGRELMLKAGVSAEDTVLAGRFDDLLYPEVRCLDFIKSEVTKGNELAKKWLPRFGSSKKALASKIAKEWGLNKQQYGKFVKVTTTESNLTSHKTDDIKFESVPSKASVKYSRRFATGADTKERYSQFIADVKAGKKQLKMATTTPYDIYLNRDKEGFEADLFFEKLKKISINALAIVDTSSSMLAEDAMGKALAIGHYIGKCSNFMPGHAITFSSRPSLVKMGEGLVCQSAADPSNSFSRWSHQYTFNSSETFKSQYDKEIASLKTGDCSNTDLGLVMELLKSVDSGNMPEYLVILSDQEFDRGSSKTYKEVKQLWRDRGYTTKIIWWNFNGRNKTAVTKSDSGDIFLSGYNPTILQFLEAGFDGSAFVHKLVEEYAKKIGK